jgi:CHAT domain-containing protein
LSALPPSSEHIIAELRNLSRDCTTLARRIQLCQQALEQIQLEDQPLLWAQLHFELGLCWLQSPTGHTAESQESAIECFQQASKVYAPPSVEWLDTAYNLALLYERHLGGQRANNIHLAIALHQEIVQAYAPKEYPVEYAASHIGLARLTFRRQEGDQAENIETATRHCRQALKVLEGSGEAGQLAEAQDLLGVLFRCRLRDDPMQNLEESLRCHQAALSVLEPHQEAFARDWARVHHNIGVTLFQHIGGKRADNLEKAISHFEQALTVRKRDTSPTEWAETKHHLAVAYVERQHGDRAENVARAIEILREVQEVFRREEFPAEWAVNQNALGNAYSRSVYGERSENLERAIQYYQQALQLEDWGDQAEERAMTQHNLGVAYSERVLGDRAENLEKAAECGRKALEAVNCNDLIRWTLIKTDIVDMLWKLANLTRYGDKEGAAALLEEAIAHGEDTASALNKHLLSHHWALVHYNLGNAYSDRIRGDRKENQEEAIKHYRHALEVYTQRNYPTRWADTHNNLGVTFLERLHGNPTFNFRQARDHFEKALKVFDPQAFPVNARRAARNLGNMYLGTHDWRKAHTAYSNAIDAGEILYQAAASDVTRQAELREAIDLYHNDAYCLTRLGSAKEAVQRLEAGKARALGEALALERAALEQATLGDRQAFEATRAQVKRLEEKVRDLGASELGDAPACAFTDCSTELSHARQRLKETIKGICAYVSDFMPEPVFSGLQAAAQKRPLVYVVATSTGGLTLIVHSTGIKQIWSHDLVSKALEDRVQQWFEYYFVYVEARSRYNQARKSVESQETFTSNEKRELESLRMTAMSSERDWLDVLDETTRWLWDVLMDSVTATLRDLGHKTATLIPTGRLTFLPLHAAWRPGDDSSSRRYALDDVAFAYAPSARTLTYVQETAITVPGNCLFAVENPDGSLYYAAQEISAIVKHYPNHWVLSHDLARRDTVLFALPRCDIYHFACHGSNDWREPLDSSLWMASREPLKVRHLLEVPGGHCARLAFLSACETGLVGVELPDEAVGLVAAFLAAGTAGVVSTLWAVDDASTAKLAGRFYANWEEQKRKRQSDPLRALIAAQQWLRDEAGDGGWEHPYYWAGFTFTGM